MARAIHDRSMMRPIVGLAMFVGMFLVGVLLVGCGDGNEAVSPTSASVSSSSNPSMTSTPSQSSSPAAGSSVTGTSAETSTTASSAGTSAGSSTTTAAPQTVEVFFSVGDGSDCGAVQPFKRSIDDTVDPYLATFGRLVAGPTAAEVDGGVGSFFSAATTGTVRSAFLNDDLLTVDFTDLRSVIPNASTSCASEALLAQLNATAFQFDNVQRTRYLLEGSCTDFGNWLQRECFETDRSGRTIDLDTNDQASGAGCSPQSVEYLPAGRWFGFVIDAEAEQLTFDLACWFTGSAATIAAAEDGEESPPPNDVYIRNASDHLRVHPVDSTTEVVWLPDPGDPAAAAVVSYATWLSGRDSRVDRFGVWITVTDDSHVIKIEEQYVP